MQEWVIVNYYIEKIWWIVDCLKKRRVTRASYKSQALRKEIKKISKGENDKRANLDDGTM